MGSLHYIAEAKDKWPEAKPQSDNFLPVDIYVHTVHAFTFTALERFIVTGLFMDQIFHLNKVC